MWDQALDAPAWHGPPLWVHTDLHPANTVVVDGVLGGIIDFGDMGAGDPAEDLAAGWLLLPSDDVSTFFASYGDVDAHTMVRARGRAAAYGVMLLAIGQAWERGLAGGQRTWLAPAQACVDRLLAT